MIIGIDGSNIRAGGGITHLKEILANYEPISDDKIILWGGDKLLDAIDDKKWLLKICPKALNKSFLFRSIWQKYSLKKAAIDNNCDMLFIPGGTYSGDFPYVSMSQNMLVFDKQERDRFGKSFTWLRLKLLEFSQAKSFKNAKGIIFISNYAKNFISNKVNINCETKIINHGISSRFFSEPKIQKNISEYNHNTLFKLLYISNIDYYKHQYQLVSAVDELINEGCNIELTLVGGQNVNYYNEFKSIVDNNDKIKYLGEVDFNLIHELYQKADGFVFASSCENMPNILIEAMSAGLPIFSSNFEPMPEFLGDNGFYFDPTNVNDIKIKLLDYLKNNELRLIKAINGFESAKQYNWKKCADETFSFINSMK